jgi:hypothetical protein
LAREFIEFFHSQDLLWQPCASDPAVSEKVLSTDSEIGSVTRLIKYPPGWKGTWGAQTLSEEIFVLDGGASMQGAEMGLHAYGYFPAGEHREVLVGVGGVVVLSFRDPPPEAPKDQYLFINTIEQAWDRIGLEGEIAHLQYARKNLRFAPDGRRRTYLLGGMPQGFPAQGARLEKHPHAEEMFMISGDMPCSLGVMKTGAYFYRPPEIEHGLDCSLGGFLIIMRTPGSNVTISEWSEDLLPVSFTPAHAPELPANHPARGATPRPISPEY